jgi:hypothetical protein
MTMARVRLLIEMDMQSRDGDTYGRYFYRRDGEWFLVLHGPGYESLYEVIEYTPEEEGRMKEEERDG